MKHKWAKPAKLNTFLKKHRGSDLPLLPDFIRPRDPVAVLIHSWLLWEASTEQAEVAMRKLLDAFVLPDFAPDGDHAPVGATFSAFL